MPVASPSPARPVIAEFSALGEMRVWSLLITIFGDAVAPRGGVVPAATLMAILERLSIKPEAMRVAIHRLVKDGWILRRKSGRQSHYALSKRGQAEFLSATQRIYATAPALTGPWQLASFAAAPDAATSEALTRAGFVPLTPVLFLGARDAKDPRQGARAIMSAVDAARWPDWARHAIVPPQVSEDYARLEQALSRLSAHAPEDPTQAAALRILLVHQWRRILLRHADLPPELLPRDWRGEACRARVLELHARLSALADPWLDQELAATQLAAQ